MWSDALFFKVTLLVAFSLKEQFIIPERHLPSAGLRDSQGLSLTFGSEDPGMRYSYYLELL